MGYSRPDPYYQPEAFGLRKVDELYDPEASYSFDMLVVWQHDDGRLFYATDAGCSCPSPYEDFRQLEDLTPITVETLDDFTAAVRAHCAESKDPTGSFQAEKVELLAKVTALLR